ncbi:MAG: hypothetical protein MI810_20290 [Flavobacteriales bacterium]|nr:hypothetical protein [Flavobacteriales bacterium]
MIFSSFKWLFILSIFSASANSHAFKEENKTQHVFYYSTVEFVETPLSKIKGSVPLSKLDAMNRNHYRFVYNDKNQLLSISFFNGETPKKPNHTANLFTLSHRMEFEYDDQIETVEFYNNKGDATKVLGNCSKFIYTHDDLGFRNSLYFLDQEGQRVVNSWGIYVYEWEYLDDGSVIEERYDDLNNKVAIRPGFEFYRLRLCFNPSGHIALMQNIDENGNLIENNSGASQDQITTNAMGHFIEWNVLNNDHQLEKGNGPDVAIGRQTFNTYGYETSLEHLDENEQNIASNYGVCKSVTFFDQFGNIKERAFYNESGSPDLHINAKYHKLIIEWDRRGNRRTSLKYYNIEDKPCEHSDRGYHEVRYEYDVNGRLSKISYLSKDGKLINRKDNGRAYSVLFYDEGSKPIVRHYDKSKKELKQ